jgi:uncharacterized protein YaaW (UPF0174 family)
MGKYVRKTSRGSWSQDELTNAIDAITKQKMPIREAGRTFGIPERTLRRKILSNDFKKSKLGRANHLGVEVELKLVNHILKLQKAGFAPTRRVVKRLAFRLAYALEIKTSFNVTKKVAGKD